MNLSRLLLTGSETVPPATEAPAAPEAAANPMAGMTQMLDLLMVVILLGAGAYALYTAIKLRRTCMLFPSKMLYPGSCSNTDCLDPEGFMDYILPRLTILGVSLLLLGIAYIVLRMVLKIDHLAFDICAMAVPFGVLVWYMFIQRRCAKLFWGK